MVGEGVKRVPDLIADSRVRDQAVRSNCVSWHADPSAGSFDEVDAGVAKDRSK
jgi:hypothetical protein